nr:MAG TPA: hypothetical protein [Caudoviricetes sp.]
MSRAISRIGTERMYSAKPSGCGRPAARSVSAGRRSQYGIESASVPSKSTSAREKAMRVTPVFSETYRPKAGKTYYMFRSGRMQLLFSPGCVKLKKVCRYPSERRQEGMKQKPAKRGARAWAIAIPAGILLLLLLAAFLIGNGGASAFRDDVDAILAAPRSEELGELSFADDGSAVVRLYKNDLYVLADESGVLPGLRRQMRERFGDLDFGIRLTGGKMRVCISQRVLGLVPVSMQIVTSLSWDGTGIVIHAESVLLGSRTALPKSLWPDSVREDFRVDLTATGRTQEVADVYLDGSAAVVETVPLRLPAGDSLHPDAQLLEKIRFFGADDKTESAAALLDRLAAGDVPSEDELPAGSRAELLAWLLALQTDDGDSAMFSTFFARRSERIREDIDAFLSAEEGKYVKLLTSVRELYKSRALRIEQNGFYVISTNRQFDPFATTELSATATDARVVLLTSGSGAPEVSQADMPVLKNVERRGAKALDGLDPEHAYDVGVVLTTDGGVPALLYRRSGGEIVVRELSAEQYVDILVSGGRPLINVDTLPAPAQELSGSECKILPLN